MTRPLAAFALIASLAAAAPTAGAAEVESLAVQVRGIFSRSCAECHGPDVAKPKGGFGFVLDLARLRGDPDYVMPGKADDSELYYRITAGEDERMPPPEHGSLSEDEIEIVRAWIATGARVPASVPGGEDTTAAPSEETGGGLLAFLGKFHPVVVHFPIALVLFAALCGILLRLTGRAEFAAVVRWAVLAGAAGAVVAACLGWLAAETGGYGEDAVSVHRWLGISGAVVACAAAILGEWTRRGGSRIPRAVFWIALYAGAALVGVAGHFGGVLVFGAHHFSW